MESYQGLLASSGCRHRINPCAPVFKYSLKPAHKGELPKPSCVEGVACEPSWVKMHTIQAEIPAEILATEYTPEIPNNSDRSRV
jgi:hypothetical protein